VPPNVEFQVDDCESEWSFKPFDYIHVRNLGGSIADWPKLLTNIYNHLAPGGYIEVVDWETYSRTDDNTLPEESALNKWQIELNEVAVKFGKEMRTAIKLKDWVTGAGFKDIETEIIKVLRRPRSLLRLTSLGPALAVGQRSQTERGRRIHAATVLRLTRALLVGALHSGPGLEQRGTAGLPERGAQGLAESEVPHLFYAVSLTPPP
jgi:SAM-dependent methyltransferase